MVLATTRFDHPFSLHDIEGMYPFERDLYAILITNYLEEQKESQSNE